MQLTKLEISGFKSFAKKTELIFKNGITGILGPNGCGKSNIADAFRFVLGEQNARALRGKRIDDFIFGGTEKRKPLSYCEVSMYFDNSDGLLASPFSEVVVTRRAFRSGESEYSINKTPARLRDIRELFRDTGIGKDGYSIIGQGRIAEIVGAKSNERRDIFKEAAGISKFRYKKQEAERRLHAAQENLEGIKDIQNGIVDFSNEYIECFKNFPYMFNISGRDAYAPMLVAASHNERYLKKIGEKFALEVNVN